MKFSPGPWKVNGDGFIVCSCGNSSIDGQDYEVTMNGAAARDGLGESDARNDAYLIAAAPEMLEILETVRALLGCKTPTGEAFSDLFEVPHEFELFRETVLQTFRKARGES